MPLIRCQQCGKAYDIPPAIAVRLPSSIAPCDCGELLCGSREAILARMAETGNIEEISVREYQVFEQTAPVQQPLVREDDEPFDMIGEKSVRVIARGARESINTVFSIGLHPLYIGRRGCHVELDDAELSIRHCEIIRDKSDLIVRDCDSHTGSFLDGEPVTEAVLREGMHLLRVGQALVCLEPTDQPGIPVEPLELPSGHLFEPPPQLLRKLADKKPAEKVERKRGFLKCIEGPLAGKEFEVPPQGLTVGREGNVRVPDEYLSRKHFVVLRDEEGIWRVRDLGSRNGTFLNTLPARNTRIHTGDEIRAGLNKFLLDEKP